MVFDLAGAVALTASATMLIAVLSHWYGKDNPRLVLWHAAWFTVAAVLGATDALDATGLGTPGLGIAVGAPLLIVAGLTVRNPRLRAAFGAIPLPTLIAINALRLLGLFFILLYWNNRLPAPFAPSAGWGDIIAGAFALPVAWAASRRIAGWRVAVLIWNCFGLLDLVSAIGLGVTSADGSPVRVFFTDPSTAIMTTLPWLLIPVFIVPNLILIHLAVFRHLIGEARSSRLLSA